MIVSVSKKAIIAAVLLVIFCAVGVCAVLNGDVQAVYSGKVERKIPVYNVDRDDKLVALTFDAAWGGDKTQQILDLLDKYGVKATFFLVGFWIDKFPDLVQKIDEAGMEIGNHSKNHYNMSKLDSAAMNDEIDYVNTKIMELTGKTPKFFRAPYGDYNNKLIDVVAQKSMIGIQWDVDSLDWKGLSGQEIATRVSKAKSGSIILCHNNSDNILDALPLIISNLQNQGYKLVTMSQLVYQQDYYIDNNGVQHLK
ncbi:MAG: polysaccharide deacetylase family protein [Christensenellales bacterium]